LAGIVIAVTEGFVGVIEIPSFMGNVFSYTRIAAVGMVGVVLAELVNQFLMPSPQQGLLALLFLPLFIGLHLLNCFIAMFESLIQGGRLNIVEFRGKFLQGGNEMFNAFALQKNDEY
jgi:V/A-type H+-transporting ATPase subunit I